MTWVSLLHRFLGEGRALGSIGLGPLEHLLLFLEQAHHGAPVQGEAQPHWVDDEAVGLVVALEHGHIVVKAEEHGLLLLRTAELAQLGPVSEGGEEGPAVLGGDELKLDGSLLLHNGLAVLLGLGGGVTTAGARRTAWWSTSSSTRPWFWGVFSWCRAARAATSSGFSMGFFISGMKMASYIEILSGQNLERGGKGLASRGLLDYTHRSVSRTIWGTTYIIPEKAGGTQDAVSENPAGDFLSRPNRFVARVEVDGAEVTCHVKNTGRCRELLVPGARVYLESCGNPGRKTAFDLIAVGEGGAADQHGRPGPQPGVWRVGPGGTVHPGLTLLRPETTFGGSRFDFYWEAPGRRGLWR